MNHAPPSDGDQCNMPLAKARTSNWTKNASAALSSTVRRMWRKTLGRTPDADARLREAIDLLPEGVVFLDPDGRYILWNQQYAEIYNRSADLFRPGVKLEHTLRIGI